MLNYDIEVGYHLQVFQHEVEKTKIGWSQFKILINYCMIIKKAKCASLIFRLGPIEN